MWCWTRLSHLKFVLGGFYLLALRIMLQWTWLCEYLFKLLFNSLRYIPRYYSDIFHSWCPSFFFFKDPSLYLLLFSFSLKNFYHFLYFRPLIFLVFENDRILLSFLNFIAKYRILVWLWFFFSFSTLKLLLDSAWAPMVSDEKLAFYQTIVSSMQYFIFLCWFLRFFIFDLNSFTMICLPMSFCILILLCVHLASYI